MENLLIDVPKLSVFEGGITGPTTPSCNGVTCGESIQLEKWRENKNTLYPKYLHMPLNNGEETIAIIPTLDETTKTYPPQIALAVNVHNFIIESLENTYNAVATSRLTTGDLLLMFDHIFAEIEKEKICLDKQAQK